LSYKFDVAPAKPKLYSFSKFSRNVALKNHCPQAYDDIDLSSGLFGIELGNTWLRF